MMLLRKCLFGILLGMSIMSVKAQGGSVPPIYYGGLEATAESAAGPKNYFVLYNIAADLYVTQGGNNGVEMILENMPYYPFHMNGVQEKQGQHVVGGQKCNKVHFLCPMNGSSSMQYSKDMTGAPGETLPGFYRLNGASYPWEAVPVEGYDEYTHVYNLYYYNSDGTYHPLRATESKTLELSESTEADPNDYYAQWQLVPLHEILREFDLWTRIYYGEPASFYINNPDFQRDWRPTFSWEKPMYHDWQPYYLTVSGGNMNINTQGNQRLDCFNKDLLPDYAQSYSVANKKIEMGRKYADLLGVNVTRATGSVANHTAGKSGMFVQAVNLPFDGWYKVSCQGFYRPVTNSDGTKSSAYLTAFVSPTTVYKVPMADPDVNYYTGYSNYLNDYKNPFVDESGIPARTFVEKPLKEIGTDQDFSTNNFTDGANRDYVWSGTQFKEGKYPNELYIYLPWSGEDETGSPHILNIGIVADNMNDNTRLNQYWLSFDKFKLEYIGESAYLLDEDAENIDYMKNREYETLLLHASLKPHKWNTFVSPVTLNGGQVKVGFGPNTEVAVLREKAEGDDDNTIYFSKVNMDAEHYDSVAIEANTPCLIKPDMEPTLRPWMRNYIDYDGVEKQMADNMRTYFIQGTSMDKPETSIINTLTTDQKTKYTFGKLHIEGTLTKTNNAVKVGNFALKDNKWWKRTAPIWSKGFHWWIVNDKTQSGAKSYRLMVDDNIVSPTSINGIEAVEEAEPLGDIYTVSGQLVRKNATSTDGLPAGCYIAKGKKLVVKY